MLLGTVAYVANNMNQIRLLPRQSGEGCSGSVVECSIKGLQTPVSQETLYCFLEQDMLSSASRRTKVVDWDVKKQSKQTNKSKATWSGFILFAVMKNLV